jgi:hypothetical protein
MDAQFGFRTYLSLVSRQSGKSLTRVFELRDEEKVFPTLSDLRAVEYISVVCSRIYLWVCGLIFDAVRTPEFSISNKRAIGQ